MKTCAYRVNGILIRPFLIIFGICVFSNVLFSQHSHELNAGSARPIFDYSENNIKQGIWDFSYEYQHSLNEVFSGENWPVIVSLGLKFEYNYFLIEKEKWNINDLDSTYSQYISAEFKYKLRSHTMSFHPCIEICTSPENRMVAYAKYYVGPSLLFTTAYVKYELDDNVNITTGWERRLVDGSKHWVLDQGVKVGAGYDLTGNHTVFLTASGTYIWGGFAHYIGKGSVKSFDRFNPSEVEVEFIESNTDRVILQLGFKFFVGS